MKNLNERKRTEVKVRYKPEDFICLKRAFVRSTCSTIAGYVRKLSLGQPVEIIHRNASFDNFVAEIVRLRSEMTAIRQQQSWTPEQRARLIFLEIEIQSTIDKIARSCIQ